MRLCVVVGTLVLQGLTLRPLILVLGLTDDGTVEREVRGAQDMLALVALEMLEADGSDAARALRDEFVTTEVTEDGVALRHAREARNHLRARIVEGPAPGAGEAARHRGDRRRRLSPHRRTPRPH